MNEQFETQNPVENTVTPANQMETPTPEALKKKGNKIAIIAGVVATVVVAGGYIFDIFKRSICSGQNRSFFKPVKKGIACRCKDCE